MIIYILLLCISVKSVLVGSGKLEDQPITEKEYLRGSLKFRQKNITGPLDTFANFKKVKEVLFIDCYIDEIVDILHTIPNLKVVKIKNCCLTEFPKNLEKCKMLEHIDFTNNRIDCLPDMSGLVNLKEAIFHHNNLSEVPMDLIALPKIVDVDLCSNVIRQLPTSVDYKIESCEILNLGKNLIRNPDCKWENFTKLRKLYLFSNKAGVFPPSLTRPPNLCELYMSENEIKVVPDEIMNMKQLQVLDLRANWLEYMPFTFADLKHSISRIELESNLFDKKAETSRYGVTARNIMRTFGRRVEVDEHENYHLYMRALRSLQGLRNE